MVGSGPVAEALPLLQALPVGLPDTEGETLPLPRPVLVRLPVALAPRWRTRGTQAQVGGDSESGPLSLRVSGPAGHRHVKLLGQTDDHRTRQPRARSACPVVNVTACKQRVNFELALRLEVDPAARRPSVTVMPVLRLPACHGASGRQYGHGHGGTGPLTARASAWVSGKCDLESDSGPKAGVPGPGACDCRRGG